MGRGGGTPTRSASLQRRARRPRSGASRWTRTRGRCTTPPPLVSGQGVHREDVRQTAMEAVVTRWVLTSNRLWLTAKIASARIRPQSTPGKGAGGDETLKHFSTYCLRRANLWTDARNILRDYSKVLPGEFASRHLQAPATDSTKHADSAELLFASCSCDGNRCRPNAGRVRQSRQRTTNIGKLWGDRGRNRRPAPEHNATNAPESMVE